jgi:hypothetical protein
MRAFLSIKYHPDNKNRERIQGISAALEQCGWETVCIVRDVERWGQVKFSPQELMQRTFDEIDKSRMIVIDLTEKGVVLYDTYHELKSALRQKNPGAGQCLL